MQPPLAMILLVDTDVLRLPLIIWYVSYDVPCYYYHGFEYTPYPHASAHMHVSNSTALLSLFICSYNPEYTFVLDEIDIITRIHNDFYIS